MPFSVGARDVGCFVWVRKTDGVLKQRLPQEAEAFPTQNPPQPPRDQHKPTATEYIDNHSSILICPLDILFAKKGPRRGASAQKSTQHYWTSQGSHKGLSIDAGGAEGWHRSKSLAWGGGGREDEGGVEVEEGWSIWSTRCAVGKDERVSAKGSKMVNMNGWFGKNSSSKKISDVTSTSAASDSSQEHINACSQLLNHLLYYVNCLYSVRWGEGLFVGRLS